MQPISFNGLLKVYNDYTTTYINTKKVTSIQMVNDEAGNLTKAYINLDDGASIDVYDGDVNTLPEKFRTADVCGGIVDYNA